MKYYSLNPERTNVASGNENGDVEQRHNRLKKAVDQELMLRGSRDFESRMAYERFLKDLVRRLNAGRRERLEEELKILRPLPQKRQNDYTMLEVSVGQVAVERDVREFELRDGRGRHDILGHNAA